MQQPDSTSVPANKITAQSERLDRIGKSSSARLLVNPTTREQIAALLVRHDRSVREVAKMHRLPEQTVKHALIIQHRVDLKRQTALAFELGRASMLPPGAARKAA